jgi:hypothetical protein
MAMGARTDGDPNWIINGTKLPSALDFQVTDEWGQVLEDDDIVWSAGQTVTGGQQFPACP